MFNNSPFFSIIIPCYNVSNSISLTLNSILNQDFDNFEVIFINDGSTDDTLNILIDFQKKSHKNVIIVNQDNKGLGAARNTGIKSSNGQYIALLDADDTWSNNKLSQVFEIIRCNISFELFCHNEFIIRSDGQLIKKNVYGPSTSFEDLIYFGNCLSPSAVVLNKNLFEKVGFFTEDRNYHGVEDYDFWLRSGLKHVNIYYIDQFLGNYIIHDNNMSTSLKFINTEEKLLLYYMINFKDRLSSKYKIKIRLTSFYLRKLYLYIKSFNFSYVKDFIFDLNNILFRLDFFIQKKFLSNAFSNTEK
jgi:glycosyltransferase involved in cell wall biosynthesis